MAILCTVADSHLYCSGTNFLTSTDLYSISVWINAVWSSGATYSFVGMYDGVPNTGTPTVGLQIGSRGTGLATCWTYGGAVLVQSATGVMSPYDNQWVLITYTYDGTNHRLYRNEVLLATSATAVATATFTQIFINGYPPTGSTSETSTQQVDTYMYYGRALTQPEIQTIYNSGGSRHGIIDGQLVRYDFDELPQGSAVSSVVDTSGHDNTLINTGVSPAPTYTYIGTYANSNLRPVQ